MLARSLVVAFFLCLLGFAPLASASTEPCPSLKPVPQPDAGSRVDPKKLACGDLHGLTLPGLDVPGADLHGADFHGAQVIQANLSHTNLTDANLRNTDLGQTDLGGADLRHATLTGASLIQAHLVGTDLRGADLTGVDLTQADLSKADLRGANLTDTDFTQTTVNGADLRGAILDGASAIEVFGLSDVRIDPVGPNNFVQVTYLFAGPAVAIAFLWWRRRYRRLLRHSPERAGALVFAAIAVPVAVVGLYVMACGLIRGIATVMAGWFWAVDPGPLNVLGMSDPGRQIELGAAAFVLGLILLSGARTPRPTGEPPVEPDGQLAIGKPSPGRLLPPLSSNLRGLSGLLSMIGMLDLIGTFVLWVVGVLPADGIWGTNNVIGHLVVVLVATVVFIRAAQPASEPGSPKALTGVVLAPGAYVFLSGTTAKKDPTSGALPWQSLEHVHLIRTLGSQQPGTAMVTIRPPGASPIEFANELPVSKTQGERLRAALPVGVVSELVRAPSSDD